MSIVKNILVTGANGQLGNECKVLASQHHDVRFVFTDVEELSIIDQAAIDKIFSENKFDYCINAAAYTAVDNAEKDEDLSRAINATAVGYLATACNKYNCRLIHISTDYVFDGENSVGYNEDDATSPINVYGATKLEGEKLALQSDSKSIVIRTSWVYSYFGKNFVKTMMKLMQERDEISVVNDQIGKPTYAADLAAVIFKIIFENEKILLEVERVLNEEEISPRRYFYPSLNQLPYVSECQTTISSEISKRIMCLPLYVGLEENALRKICALINSTIEKFKER